MYQTLVTRRGKEKAMAAAVNGEKLKLVHAAVGDGGGSYYLPEENQVTLKNEVWRGSIAQAEIDSKNPNMLNVKIVVPEDAGGFTVRECGVFDAEGELVAVCNLPATEKVILDTGGENSLTILLHLVLSDAGSLDFVVDPSFSATLADIGEAIEQHNEDKNAHPKIWESLEKFQWKAIRQRTRDPSKNDFGLGDETVYLEVGPYTGTAEVAVQLSGEMYDAANISHNGSAIPDGNFIISKEEC